MSQVDAVTEKIGGREYEMYMLPPMESHELLMDVMRMVGPALGPLFDSMFGGDRKPNLEDVLDQELGSGFFTKAADALFKGIDKAVVRNVISSFQTVTHVDGKPLERIFIDVFRGELDGMYRWLVWGMRVQWGKSFSALASAISDQSAKLTPGALRSPST